RRRPAAGGGRCVQRRGKAGYEGGRTRTAVEPGRAGAPRHQRRVGPTPVPNPRASASRPEAVLVESPEGEGGGTEGGGDRASEGGGPRGRRHGRPAGGHLPREADRRGGGGDRADHRAGQLVLPAAGGRGRQRDRRGGDGRRRSGDGDVAEGRTARPGR